MKDIVIPSRLVKRGVILFACCFVAGCAVNLWSIIKFGSSWWEMLTSLGYVVLFSAAIFIVALLLWLAGLGIVRVLRRKKKK